MSMLGEIKGRASDAADRLLAGMGFGHTESRLAKDAARYWTGEVDDGLRNNTHFKDGSVFQEESWEQVGRDHLALFERMAQMTGARRAIGRAIEWGVGGGSNAVAFAPHVTEFVGVDVTQEIVDEAAHQVAKHTQTRFEPVVVDVTYPEAAEQVVGLVDLFLCTYVLELVPSPKYGLRVMGAAYRMLRPGGLAFVQIKYDTGEWRTKSRRRRYRGSVAASMTTYRIDEFWELMVDTGFEPVGVHLVPRNNLDERYAYFLLQKPLRVK